MPEIIAATQDKHCPRQRVEGTVYRSDRADLAIVDKDERKIRVSFSSDKPYLRSSFWEDPWIEVLGHKDDEVDLSRLNNGATVHYNHSRTREDRLGGVLEASTNGKRSSAVIQLSERESIDDIWNDLEKGLITNTSVGYKIHERVLVKKNDDGPDEYRVTKWEPLEISLVDIPADPTVGVGRNENGDHFYRVIDLETAPAEPGNRKEDDTMSKTKETKPAVDKDREDDDTVQTVSKSDADAQSARAAKDATTAALENEATRQSDIRACFDGQVVTDGTSALLTKCLENQQCSLEDARKFLLDEIGKDKSASGSGHFQPGEDQADKFREGSVNAIQVRAGVPGIKLDPENNFRGLTLSELARAALTMNNLDSQGERSVMIGRALTMRATGIGLTPSDFSEILADVAHKSVLLGFDEAMETWEAWCRVGNLTDFKIAHRVGLSSFEDLELIGAGGEYKYGKFTDTGETIQLASYGKIFPLSRQAIINDDLNVFTTIPMKQGRAAARVPGDLAYAALTTNPNMSDGVALFHANHNNIAGTPAAPTVASVDAARVDMALQTDISGSANGLNTQLGFLLVPKQLEGVSNVLRRSEFDPDATGNTRAPNSVQNTFLVVADPRLSAASTQIWYAAADVNFDTVEVAFLDGIQEPRVEEKAGWTVDGAEFKVALDVAAAPMEFRSFVRNAGV